MTQVSQPRSAKPWRALGLPIMALTLGFVGVQGTKLWAEYRALLREWDDDVKRRVIGYPGVTPYYSLAQGPADWVHDEGETTLLWAGWDRKANKHQWFTVGKGEVSAGRLTYPMGRDSIRAIDVPRIESRGGEIWERIPADNIVVAAEFQGIPIAYPMGVLDKVMIVNDMIHKTPFLIVYSPFVSDEDAVEMYTPVVDGKPLTMGHSGYLWDGRPLLYDRETNGLWVPSSKGLAGIAGTAKGKVIQRILHLDPTPWGKWSSDHPEGRLVAGAIRHDFASARKK